MNLVEFELALTTNLKDELGKNTRVWVWPEYDGVKGFYGSGVINDAVVIWITERPSAARDKLKEHKFPDWIDKRFYSLLKAKGLGNMHLTDFVKIMDIARKRPTKEELEISTEWMRKEMGMLCLSDKKSIIIANTTRVKQWMDEYLPSYPCIYKPFFKNLIRFGKANLLKEILSDIYRMTVCRLSN